ncbi:alpha/beta fold hydrolase [Amycolatopsis sp. SID8362]|uniref:alpha/beta fold hydrolase n=1 Tax=Amycolatopsis sp. SID8362 TaxID=2690346 RepID=UPI00136FB665|nr:alpha/beta fold hydrolase [Amycolatopsis sp. SID8362]NBH06502.1 alpha/beta fold hydrolase [Amycolatopsis sp. SID8362]NED43199.1 alpha/beta hydrolase [Amycolatopsis sp. SID8362]
MTTVRYGYATVPGGQVHYAEQGIGPAVLLLHQTPRSLDEFRELQPSLAGDHRVLALDMPGFGNSTPLPAPQRIEDYAHGVLAALDALGVDRTAVLGHHTGGVVAVELAAAAPERVTAVVLSSTPWADAGYRASHVDGPGVDDAAREPGGGHLLTWWEQRRPHYPEAATALLDRFVRDALAPGVDPREGHLACARYEMERRIGEVRAPVLLLGGSDDPFALPALASLERNLTAAAVVERAVIDGGTVALMEDKAEEVAAVVLPFLRRSAD